MSFSTLEGFPVRFNSPDDICDTYDQRTYCQMVEQDDPIHFAWRTYVNGEDVVQCGGFETEACIQAEWTLGDWGFSDDSNNLDEGYVFIGTNDLPATQSQPLIQESILSNGCWIITVTIPGYPHPFEGSLLDDSFEHYDYAGNFFVRAGNWTSQATPVTPGTHIFYAEITSGSDLEIVPDDAIIAITEITAKTICCDYSLLVKDTDGNLVEVFDANDFIGTEGIFREKDIMYFKATWASFGLENGCYQICIVNNCDQVIQNGTFDQDSDGDLDVDVNDFIFSWSPSNGNVAWGSGWVCHDSGSTTLTQSVNLHAETTYILKYCLTICTGDISTITFTVGGQIVALRLSAQGAGTFYAMFTTGLNPTDSVVVTFGNGFDGCLTCISLTPVESCSQCYDLGSHPCTKLLKWYNDDDAFGIPYSSMIGAAYSLDYANFLRVTALLEKPRYPQESDRFTYSDGRRKILHATSEKIWTLTVDYLPQYIHDSLALAKIHDHFFIDDIEYICVEGNYEPEWRGRLRLAQSKIEVQKVIDNNRNKNC